MDDRNFYCSQFYCWGRNVDDAGRMPDLHRSDRDRWMLLYPIHDLGEHVGHDHLERFESRIPHALHIL